ncbi:MAG: FlgO family outer membrane protein [Smithella sp.]
MKLLPQNTLIVFITIILAIFVQTSSLYAYEREIGILASTLATSIKNHGKKVIAVVDFTDLEGNTNELGRFVAEELAGDLINTNKGFDVVDRNHLKSLLAENKLSMSGLVDPGSVKKLGRIAGADALVTGSLTPLGDSVRISCKAIDMSTAKVMGVAKGYIAKTAAIANLLKPGINEDNDLEKRKPSPEPVLTKRIEGQYSATGRNPNGTTYSGIVTITKKNGAYMFTWKIGSGTYSGSGYLEGNMLTVQWGAPYPVIYRVQADGSLLGTWNNGAATENLTPL